MCGVEDSCQFSWNVMQVIIIVQLVCIGFGIGQIVVICCNCVKVFVDRNRQEFFIWQVCCFDIDDIVIEFVWEFWGEGFLNQDI